MKYILLLLAVFQLQSCFYNHHSFTVKPAKENKQVNTAFRTDGVYYRSSKKDYHYNQDLPASTTYNLQYFIPYNNGLMIETGIASDKKITTERDSLVLLINGNNKNKLSGKQSYQHAEYGGYTINGDSLTIETIRIYRWNGFFTVRFVGKIIDKESIFIYYEEMWSGKKIDYRNEINATYSFLPATKVDSIKNNRWAKKSWFWKD